MGRTRATPGLQGEREGGGGARWMGRPPSLCQQLQGQRWRPTTPLPPAAVGAASLGQEGKRQAQGRAPAGLMFGPLAPRAAASRCSWDAWAAGTACPAAGPPHTQSGAPPLAAATAGSRYPRLGAGSNL